MFNGKTSFSFILLKKAINYTLNYVYLMFYIRTVCLNWLGCKCDSFFQFIICKYNVQECFIMNVYVP